MKKIYIIAALYCTLLTLPLASCKKGWLQEQPNDSYSVPRTLEDCRQLLDNEMLFSQTPAAGTESADEYYVTDQFYQALNPIDKRLYTWSQEIYDAQTQAPDWNLPYEQVFYANLVLQALDGLDEQSSLQQTLKGIALFLRAYAFYNLAQLYAPPYDNEIASSYWGIPLRLHPDVRTKSHRTTVEATYQQMINDLQAAVSLLPDSIDWVHRNRPAQASAYALLARVYLSMRQYTSAMAAADKALRQHATLIDFNTLDLQARYPFTATNEETLYQSRIQDDNFLAVGFMYGLASIDSTLYRLYEPGDLRRIIYFDTTTGVPVPKGSYYGDHMLFTGLATDELYLIRAECRARQKDVAGALADLNALREKRWNRQQFVALDTHDYDVALDWILTERRKELLLRGQRWTDVRRLNKELTGNKITLTRICEGQTRELAPNASRNTLPIPPQVVVYNQLQQNPR